MDLYECKASLGYRASLCLKTKKLNPSRIKQSRQTDTDTYTPHTSSDIQCLSWKAKVIQSIGDACSEHGNFRKGLDGYSLQGCQRSSNKMTD